MNKHFLYERAVGESIADVLDPRVNREKIFLLHSTKDFHYYYKIENILIIKMWHIVYIYSISACTLKSMTYMEWVKSKHYGDLLPSVFYFIDRNIQSNSDLPNREVC